MRTSSPEKSPQDTAVLRWGTSRRRSAPIPSLGAAFSPYGIVVLERLFRLTSVRGIFYIEAAILFGLGVFRLVMTLRKPRENTQIAAAE